MAIRLLNSGMVFGAEVFQEKIEQTHVVHEHDDEIWFGRRGVASEHTHSTTKHQQQLNPDHSA